MSHLGLKILYNLLNNHDWIAAERAYCPWIDMDKALRSRGLLLTTIESGRPLSTFDIVGFSVQHELSFTNILTMLDLSGIPFLSKERGPGDPLIIGGGPACFNPEPLAPIFDAFVIGDGEPLIGLIAEILRRIPKEKKSERLVALSALEGVWVPALQGCETVIRKSRATSLDEDALPLPPVLPICDITHDRYVVEVMRGCTWGCRFCQAGYANRPLRVRTDSEILRAVEKGIRQTGWEEVSLLSFSILDYPDLLNLIRRLNEILSKKRVSISLPAMRGELFTEELALLLREIKKSGLTFAPETASEGLRRRLNKSFSNERLISSIDAAYRLGWKQVKLYFMVGLPFEKDSDIDEINELSTTILETYRKGRIKLSLSPFVPKPHTPFESVEFAPIETLESKIDRVRQNRKRRLDIKYQSPQVSYIEAVLSRADERIFPVIEAVYRKGGKFEEWREGFEFMRWQESFQENDVDPDQYLKAQKKYPWDIVDTGVSKEFLRNEFQQSRIGAVTENCFYNKCVKCGACDGDRSTHHESKDKYLGASGESNRQLLPAIYRVKYTVAEPYRYASHLDITRAIYRTLRRSDLPIRFTQGFAPIPKVAFGPPKSVGQISKSDFFDLYLDTEYFGNISRELNTHLPAGIRVLDVRALSPKTPSLSSSINLIQYEVEIDRNELKRTIDPDSRNPLFVVARSGKKNILDGLESISIHNGNLTCGLYYGTGQINIYDLISYLTGLPAEQAKKFKVTRTMMFIKKNDERLSPMEVT